MMGPASRSGVRRSVVQFMAARGTTKARLAR
jgi:hypothetical protein